MIREPAQSEPVWLRLTHRSTPGGGVRDPHMVTRRPHRTRALLDWHRFRRVGSRHWGMRRGGANVQEFLLWLQPYRPLFEALNAAGSTLAVITWLIAIPLILNRWRRGDPIRARFGLMGISAAVAFGGAAERRASLTAGEHPKPATVTAAQIVAKAFGRKASRLEGKKILWVDDQPLTIALETPRL
jgi:hypothetical protein